MKQVIIIFITIIVLSYKAISEDRIVFSIKDLSYTTIDINKNIKYYLLSNKLEFNQDNYNKYYNKQKKYFIEIKLFTEFLKEKKIIVSDKDINNNYVNLINFLSGGDIIQFNKSINYYQMSENEIKKQLQNEIIIKIAYDMIKNEIEIEENVISLDIEDYIKYKINNIILYKENIDSKVYKEQKKDVIAIIKNYNFENAVKLISEKNYNINFYLNKWIETNQFNKEIIDLITNSNNNEIITYENETGLFVIQKVNKKNPDINIYYSFLQLVSNSKNVLNNMRSSNNLCNEDKYSKILNQENITGKLYNKIHIKDLNKFIYHNLQKENNKILISNDNNSHMLIVLCKLDYDKNELKEFAFENENLNEYNILKNRVIKNLKKKYNYIEY